MSVAIDITLFIVIHPMYSHICFIPVCGRCDWTEQKKKKIRSSPPEVFFDFIETTFRHGCSLVNWLQVFRIQLPKNTSRELLLNKNNVFLYVLRHEIADSTLAWSCFFFTRRNPFKINPVQC